MPGDEIAVGGGRRSEVRRRTAGLRGNQAGEFARQHGERPEISGDVVDREEQHPFAAAAEQGDAHQRTALQVERTVRGLGQPLVEGLRRQAAGVLGEEFERLSVHDLRDRLAALPGEGGVQDRMAGDQGRAGAGESGVVHLADEAGHGHDVVGCAAGRQPLHEPERALAVRSLHSVDFRADGRSGFRRREPREDLVRQVRKARSLQQTGERGRDAQGGFDPGLELRRPQRVEAVTGERPLRIEPRRGEAERPGRRRVQPGEQRRGRLSRWRLLRSGLFADGAPPHHHEIAGQPGVAGGAALNLAAGGLGQGGRADQHHLPHLRLVLLGDRLPHRFRDPLRIHPGGALHLGDHDQPLGASGLDRERGDRSRPHRGMARLGRGLDVLRIMVAAAQDDQVLLAPGDEQLAVLHEPEVAGAQEGSLALARQARSERRERLLRPVPIAGGDAGSRHPDLPHLARQAGGRRRRIDDHQPLVRQARPVADQPLAVRLRHHPARFERTGLKTALDRSSAERAAADDQRRLRQSVAGIERLPPEAAGREGCGEALQRRGPHRLGAGEGELPARQVERRAVRLRNAPHAQVVGEVGSAGDRDPAARDRRQPAQRVLQEGDRRHQDDREAAVERLQDAADQPHVMVRRQPDHTPGLQRVTERAAQRARVVEQVAVGEHHPLGGAGRARGVLQEGQGAGSRVRLDPEVRPGARQAVGRDPGDVLQIGSLLPPAVDAGEDRGRGERHPRPRIVEDRAQPRQAAVEARRIGGHRDGARIEAAEEGRDVLEPRRIEQQRALPAHAAHLEQRGDRARPQVELAVRQMRLAAAVIVQEREGPRGGALPSPRAQDLDPGRKFTHAAGGHDRHALLR